MVRSLPWPEMDGGSRSKPVMDNERLAEAGDGQRKAPVRAGSNGQRPAQYGDGRRKPPSELVIDSDKLAETGDER